MDSYIREFLLDCELRGLSPRTIKGLRNILNSFNNYIQNEYKIHLNEVTSSNVKGYVIYYLNELKRSELYINSIIKYLRMFYVYMEENEYVDINPMKKVKFVKEPKTIINTFNDKEVKRMLLVWSGRSFLEIRNKTIVSILFETGIRNTELCDITLNDIINDNAILIHGKGNKQRLVPISIELRKILEKYLRCRESYSKDKIETNYLFISYRHNNKLTVETIERIIKTTGQMANVRKGIRCSPHTIRHYYAEFNIRNKMDLYSVSRLLGHESTQITNIYLRQLTDKQIVEENSISVISTLNRKSSN